MTATNETPAAPPEPPEAQWIPAPDPESTTTRTRSESDGEDGDRGHPVGHWIAGGTGGAGLGAAELWHAFGPLGLIVGGATAAVPAAAYGAYKLRGDGKGRNRSPFSKGGGGRKSTARMGSVGLSKGKTPKLFGGKGPKLSGGKGPKLGKGSGPKFSKGGGPKLGKGAGPKLSGGKGPKFGSKSGGGSGKGPKLFGGGRGSSPGGKPSKGKGGTGTRSSTSTGGRTPKTRIGRAAQAIGRGLAATPPGRRVTKAAQAAKSASADGTKSGAGRWSRWNAARRAARGRLSKSNNPFVRAFAAPTAGLLALLAMWHERWKRQHAEAEEDETAETKTTDGDQPAKGAGADHATESSVTHEADPKTGKAEKTEEQKLAEFKLAFWKKRLAESIAAFESLKADGLISPRDEAEHMRNRRRIEDEIAELERFLGIQDQTTPTPDFAPKPGPSTTTRRNMTSNQFPLADAAQQVEAAAGRYWPQTMWHVDQDLEQIHLLPEAIANAVQAYTQSLQAAYPIDRVVIEALFRMYTALGQVAVSCMEIPKLFKDVHAEDIKRRTAPRTGEDKWNV